MRRRTVILGLVAISCAITRRAAAWTLITPEESERERAEPYIARSVAILPPGAPIIEVVQPDATKPIKPPLTIQLRFVPQGTSQIDVTSFHALYGWLRLDITNRILQHAQVTVSGLVANNADIPPGHYSITLEIADNLHRIGMRKFDFTVV